MKEIFTVILQRFLKSVLIWLIISTLGIVLFAFSIPKLAQLSSIPLTSNLTESFVHSLNIGFAAIFYFLISPIVGFMVCYQYFVKHTLYLISNTYFQKFIEYLLEKKETDINDLQEKINSAPFFYKRIFQLLLKKSDITNSPKDVNLKEIIKSKLQLSFLEPSKTFIYIWFFVVVIIPISIAAV